MAKRSKYDKHYEETLEVFAEPDAVFSYADDPKNFSAHMNQSSMMMAGSTMKTIVDEGKGQKVGSHIKMNGKIFGITLFLDEVITRYEPPLYKEWETVGRVNLIVIDHYALGFEITPHAKAAKLTVFIDYNLPQSWRSRWLGVLFGEVYAKWCVRQMSQGVRKYFQGCESR